MERKYGIMGITLAVLVLFSSMLVTGCGQKGDLYLPHDKASSSN
jgi:predicted small lipoprotein YifL